MFWSAFLLFVVQPLLGKALLPWFGGATGVWTTAMLAFQSLLMLGYVYAWLLNRCLPPRAEVLVHVTLVAASLLLLPILPDARWRPGPNTEPIGHVLMVLLASAGVPYFLLAATSPLLQAWYHRAFPGEAYRLFALSNSGSLLGLAAYPILLEPLLPLRGQATLWGLGFSGFALCCIACGWCARHPGPRSSDTKRVAPTPVSIARCFMWLAASAGPSALLLATTNHLCQDVATAPFLWVLPLSAYLVSLIICFDRPQIVRPRLWAAVAIFAITASSLLTLANTKQFLPLLMTDLAVLFSLSMFSHGLLARMRPEGERLPLFYVMVAFGGALGGASVALAAPLVFNRYYEWNFALVAGYLVSVVLLLIREKNQNRATRKQAQRVPAWRRRALAGLLTVGLAGVAAVQAGLFDPQRKYDVLCTRNFYGAVRIAEFAQGDSHHGFAMQHGGVMHGLQFTSDKLRRLPTTYYHPGSGIGQVLLEAKDSKREGRHIGVIGLGTGTLAAYGRSGDTFRFYEIDPQVVGLAKSHFTFLHDSKAACHVALGDARLVLEAEPPRNFDVLVLDAFSGDAIPVHLLTRQAIHVYLRHLKPDGVLAIHVSNKSFNLIPVVAALLNEAGFHARHLRTTTAATPGATTADWILASASPHGLPTQGIPLHAFPGVEPWRDDYSNLFDALDWR